MHARDWIVVVLLTLGVAVELLCCVGLLLGKDVWDKLHFLGPASAVGPPLLAAAVVVHEGMNNAALKAVLVALIVFVVAPVLTHATARAAHARGGGELCEQPIDDER